MFVVLEDDVKTTDDELDNEDTINATQNGTKSTIEQAETETTITPEPVQTTEKSTSGNTQTEESTSMPTTTLKGKHCSKYNAFEPFLIIRQGITFSVDSSHDSRYPF